ncbi:hypothetical protein GZ78_18725 [Endozoicomonas numazuensis]|uniref:Uncharacterized protein n=1 Tax=Endozoicomonas numazuensis TaxID=1137799 RepID=A0A081NE56_9GAMM|nr:hypothetical protein GZ78_18725 [Endozoicomonas numazuensis]
MANSPYRFTKIFYKTRKLWQNEGILGSGRFVWVISTLYIEEQLCQVSLTFHESVWHSADDHGCLFRKSACF